MTIYYTFLCLIYLRKIGQADKKGGGKKTFKKQDQNPNLLLKVIAYRDF